MFVIANSLAFNGGSTFIVRLAREYDSRGKRIGVLILVNKIDTDLLRNLEKVADVYFLKDFVVNFLKWTHATQLIVFMPIKFMKLKDVIVRYGNHVHVMGIFGLLFVDKFVRVSNYPLSVSAGVYHQYEYMFNSTSFLTDYAQKIFKSLNCENVVFFNEINKTDYSKFFSIDFSNSLLVPIGIVLPKIDVIRGSFDSYRIVSIGNLYPFKTYNLHIASLMPELLKLNDKITYEIYGVGELESEINSIIKKLNLHGKVLLKGNIPYNQFSEVLVNAFLFVGSGTAILEASALGVPSIVGIESSQEPVTFGFLSDVSGFSYNEFNEHHHIFPILDKIETIVLEPESWSLAANACKAKSYDFSILHTINGFEQMELKNNIYVENKLSFYFNIKLLFSFLYLGVNEIMGSGLSRRRDRYK